MKITEEQLNKVKEIQIELNRTLSEIGIIESQKHGLLHKIKEINEADQIVRKELEEEYGAININIEDGSYTEVEKPELLENVE